MDDRQARAIVIRTGQEVLGRPPTLAEVECVQGVGRQETHYGDWWHGDAGEGSRNWGAVHCWKPEWGCFKHKDISTVGEGYFPTFQIYPDDDAAARDVWRYVMRAKKDPGGRVLAAANSGNVDAFSRALWNTGYYTRFSPTQTDDERIAEHAKAMRTAFAAFERAGLPRFMDMTRSPLLVARAPGARAHSSSSGGGAAALALGALWWLSSCGGSSFEPDHLFAAAGSSSSTGGASSSSGGTSSTGGASSSSTGGELATGGASSSSDAGDAGAWHCSSSDVSECPTPLVGAVPCQRCCVSERCGCENPFAGNACVGL